MKQLLFPLTAITSLVLSACGMAVIPGSGKIASSNRLVSGYTRLSFAAPGELTITQDGKEALSIEADDNLLPYIHTEVENGMLNIYVTPGISFLQATQTIRYKLSVKTLDQVSLDGSGRIQSADLTSGQFALRLNGSGEIALGNLKVDSLGFDLNGSGSLNLETLTAKKVRLGMDGSGSASIASLSADEVRATINGSGSYLLKGKAASQTVRTLGSGSYNAQKLESQRVSVTITGSGDSQIWATELLDVSILGSGDLRYQGKPKITQQINGSGSVYSVE